MKVLLTTSAAPFKAPFSTQEKRAPVGVGFLISVLRDAGHQVLFIDNYLEPSDFLETGYLQKEGVDFVGIYTNTICFRDSLRMFYKMEEMRQRGQWQGKIIAGGPHASVCPETVPEFVDHIVIGEGEQAILDIVEGRVFERLVRYPCIENLDDLPMPAWDYFAKLPYNWGGSWLPEPPLFTMNTSRGCPFDCTFCSVGSVWGRRYTYFSAERIIADIEHVVTHYGAKGIYFREDNFTLNKERLTRFCELMIDKKIGIPWVCETRASSLDEKTVALMARAGAKAFYIGVESGSQRLLDFMKKGISVEDIRRAFRLAHQYGITAGASMIVGVPTETPEDLKTTSELLKEIKPSAVWSNIFVGIPKSTLYQYSLDQKLYEFIDDRGLVYLKGHNERVEKYYGKSWDARMPIQIVDGRIENPDISVLMSVHNGEQHLEKAIGSVLKQTFLNFEFIIVDDASCDQTATILQKFNDPRIRLLHNPENLGLTRSLNRAAQNARGRYLARIDADDHCLPHRLEEQFHFLEQNPDHGVVGCAYYIVDDEDKVFRIMDLPTSHDDISNALQEKNVIAHGAAMVRASVFAELDGYDERFTYAQDYDLWLRLTERAKAANLPALLYCWRRTRNSLSWQKREEQASFAQLARSEAAQRRNQPQQMGL